MFGRKRSCNQVIKSFEKAEDSFVEALSSGTAVVTGGTSGVGKYVANKLASLGGTVIVVCRNTFRGRNVVSKIKQDNNIDEESNRVRYLNCDLSSLKKTVDFCNTVETLLDEENLPPLRLLLLNAAIKPTGRRRKVTWDGFEKTFQVNYLSQFMIYFKLKERLLQNRSKVVVVTDSAAQKGPFDVDDFGDVEQLMRKLVKPQYVEDFVPENTYNASKVCGMAFAKSAFDGEREVFSCSVSPERLLVTNLRQRRVTGRFLRGMRRKMGDNTDSAVANVLHCCLCPPESLSGDLFDKFSFKSLPQAVSSEDSRRTLFSLSSNLCSQFLKHQRDSALNPPPTLFHNHFDLPDVAFDIIRLLGNGEDHSGSSVESDSVL